jgi:maltooligosyltrehalose trehalohydrolase
VDGEGAQPVRDFFIHNALYWIEEFHIDGLRFDAVHAIVDDRPTHFSRSSPPACAPPWAEAREVHLVLENEANQARWLPRDANGRPRLHTAQWADDSHNSWHPLLTGEAEGYYEDFADKPVERLGRALAEGFVYQGEPSRHHDGKPAASPPPTCRPPPSWASCRTTTRSATAPSGSASPISSGRTAWRWPGALPAQARRIPLLCRARTGPATAPFPVLRRFRERAESREAVRNGRAAGIRQRSGLRGPRNRDRLPDPTARRPRDLPPRLGTRSPPRRTGRSSEETRALLRLRHEAVVPLTKSRYRGAAWSLPQADALDVLWRFEAGRLRLIANFGSSDAAFAVGGLSPVWSSPEARREGRQNHPAGLDGRRAPGRRRMIRHDASLPTALRGDSA